MVMTNISQKKRCGAQRKDHQHPRKMRRLATTIEREEGEALSLE